MMDSGMDKESLPFTLLMYYYMEVPYIAGLTVLLNGGALYSRFDCIIKWRCPV